MTLASPALRSLARFSVIASMLMALALAWLYHFAPRHLALVELTRYAPFLIYLVPGLTALALSWLLAPLWRVIAALALTLMLTAVMDVSTGLRSDPLPPDAEAAGVRPVRLMTYNIKSYRAAFRWGGFVPLNNEIASQQPDILVMQDAREVSRAGDLPFGMREVLPKHKLYAYGEYAIASRFPLSDCRLGDISFRDEKLEYIRCTVDIGGTLVDVITVHLLTPRAGLNAARFELHQGLDDWSRNVADRMTQVDALVRDLVPLRRPTILAGDLNAPEHSPVVRTLMATGLRNAFSTAGRGWGYTHGHSLKPWVSFLRIDHILVSPEIGVTSAHVGWRGGSEHRPVIADLLVPVRQGLRQPVDKSVDKPVDKSSGQSK